MDVPLSTLNYAYPRTRLLFEDLIENSFNQHPRAQFTTEQVVRLLDTIAERAAEHYRVPHHVLGNLILSFTNGQTLHWIETGDEHTYWATVLAGIDGAVLLADPRPRDEPHLEPTPRDYANVPVPDPT